MKLSANTGNYMKLKLRNIETEILIVSLYCSNNLNLVMEEFGKLVNQAQMGKLIIMGDINIDLLDENERNGFHSIQNEKTRGESCLDHVFVRYFDDSAIKTSTGISLEATGITDHSGVLVTLKSLLNLKLKLGIGNNDAANNTNSNVYVEKR